MQQSVLFVVLALCLASMAQASICTVSGDPHWTTFDGCYHDFQGQGSFVHVNNDYLKVQANHQPCNSPHAVTCVRSVSTQVSRPAGRRFESVTFTWGIFYSPTVDPLTVDGVVVPASQCQRGCNAPINSTGNDVIAKFTFNGATLVINTPDNANVTQGRFYLQIALPSNDLFLGTTNGLCGTHDGDGTNEFTYPNGTLAFTSVVGSRFNGPNTNKWAAAFAVGTDFPPLATHYHRYDAATKQIYSVPALQELVIPSDEVQATLNGVNFPDPDKVNEIQDKCLALYPAAGIDSVSVKNCIYDAAALPGLFVLAASNQVAQASADAQMGVGGGGSDSGLNRDQIVGLAVGLGLCGLIALVVAGVLYHRLRKVSAAYQNALIVRAGSSQTGMRVNENL